MQIYNILEVANTHNGNIEYVFDLLEEFCEFENNIGIKFQPFHYDLIATKEFEWYPVYKELYFDENQWKSILTKAKGTKDIWLDIFDSYSVKILAINFDLIRGIKFQSSTLKNKQILRELRALGNTNKLETIINISGYELDEIKKLVNKIEKELHPKKIILQVGFQDYPTRFEDTGLNKIKTLQNTFNYEISFADHLDAEDEESIRLPVLASLLGATYIEKHIKHSSLETKQDYYSSIDINKYRQYHNLLIKYTSAYGNEFINEREKVYLNKSIQIPIASRNLDKGRSVNLIDDLCYKRSKHIGLNFDQIEELINSYHILREDIEENKPFQNDNFIKAKIATIIAVRMKSSRLPKKALLKIGGLTSIELCIKNCLKFENVDYTIMATSDMEEDSILKDYTFDKSVIFHQGDPIDVIKRYLDIIEKLKIDVVIRVTGDCPFLSNDILQIVLKSHFQNGADYSRANYAAIGTNIEIINSSALRKVKDHFPSADYSEYMTYYFTNNPNYFRLNFVDLPNDLIRNYRLTLDYQEDLRLFNDIVLNLGIDCTIREIFKYLDNNPEKANINAACSVKYLTDKSLVKSIKLNTTIS